MPELPEVETIRNQLSTYLPLKIESVWTSKVVKSILHTPIPRNRKPRIHRTPREDDAF